MAIWYPAATPTNTRSRPDGPGTFQPGSRTWLNPTQPPVPVTAGQPGARCNASDARYPSLSCANRRANAHRSDTTTGSAAARQPGYVVVTGTPRTTPNSFTGRDHLVMSPDSPTRVPCPHDSPHGTPASSWTACADISKPGRNPTRPQAPADGSAGPASTDGSACWCAGYRVGGTAERHGKPRRRPGSARTILRGADAADITHDVHKQFMMRARVFTEAADPDDQEFWNHC